MTTRLVLFGPPGVGKGTQSALLCETLGIATISTGDLFRQHIEQQDDLGRAVAATLTAGGLVDDEVTTAMVEQRLAAIGSHSGFVLDGYPRTVRQAADLDRILGGEHSLTAVLLLYAAPDVLTERLLHRAEQQSRTDDTPMVIRRRLEVYETTTAPLLARYNTLGLVRRIDGVGDVGEVQHRLLQAVRAEDPGM